MQVICAGSCEVVAAQALEQWAALSSEATDGEVPCLSCPKAWEDARCVARVLRRPVLAVLQRLAAFLV